MTNFFNILDFRADQKLLWAPLYEAVLDILGPTGIIIPIGDTNHENLGRTTVTTIGELAAVFTYSEAMIAFDTPPSSLGPGRIPIVTFNGTDEEADSPDAAYWTRALLPFSVGAWVNFSGGDPTSSTILSKYHTSGATREWRFLTTGGDALELEIVDEDDAVTPDATIRTIASSPISASGWVFCVATYDGTANASGIDLYIDGVLVASTDTDDANFISMRDKGGTVKLGFENATPNKLFDGQIGGGPFGPFFVQAQLSADAIRRLYQLARAAADV